MIVVSHEGGCGAWLGPVAAAGKLGADHDALLLHGFELLALLNAYFGSLLVTR